MKKLFTILAVVVMVAMMAFTGYAQDAAKSASSNPIDVAKSFLDSMNVKIGIEPYSEILLSRKVAQDGMSAELASQWYGAKADIRILDIITLSPFVAGVGTGGQFQGEQDIDSDMSFGYGLEARVDLPLKLSVDLAVLGMIRTTSADLNKVGDYELKSDKDLNYLDYAFEIQVSKALNLADYKIPIQGTVTPILGVRYSDLRISGNPEGEKLRMKAKNNIGMTVGAQYDLNDTFGISVKGKLIDQAAIEVAGIVRF
jgi:hypothetical protein